MSTVSLLWSCAQAPGDGGAAGAISAGTAASDAATGRVSGADRYSTSAAISRRAFPGGADVAYLARGDEFADAVAGGALTGGPILLVRGCGSVPDAVSTELARLDPDQVIALGGTGAICEATLGLLGVELHRPTRRRDPD